MRKALGLILSPLLLGSTIVGSSLVAPQLTSVAQAQVKTFNIRDVSVCRSRQDLKTLASYIRNQQSFGVTPEGANKWRKDNGLRIPQATTAQSVVVQGNVMIRVNGLQVPVKNIDVTLPLLPGGNDGDYYNLATAVLKIRGAVYGGCINTRDKNQPFVVEKNFDFAWQNVKVERLNTQNSQPDNSSNDEITSY